MSSSVDVSTQTGEILTFENIIATLSALLSRLSQLKDSVPQSISSNNATYNNGGSNDLNNDNTTITAATTDNNSGSNDLNTDNNSGSNDLNNDNTTTTAATTDNNSGSNDLNNDNTTITAATTDKNSGSNDLNNDNTTITASTTDNNSGSNDLNNDNTTITAATTDKNSGSNDLNNDNTTITAATTDKNSGSNDLNNDNTAITAATTDSNSGSNDLNNDNTTIAATIDSNSGSNDLNNDNTTITAATIDNNSGSSYLINGHPFNEECLVTRRQFDKLQRDLNQIKEAFSKLKNFEQDAGEPIKNIERCLDDISKIVSEDSNDAFPNKEVQAKLSAIKKDALKLKLNFPSLRSKMSTKDSVHRRSRPTNGSNSVVNEFPSLHMNHEFVCSSVFTEFKEVFENLDMRLKLCLLSFAVLPEDVVVKRRLLINWWVGEGLVDPPSTGEKKAENVADEILKELELKGFIEHVKGTHKPVANRNRFKMQPLVHCVVFMLAQEAGFFDCQFNGIPTVNSSRCNRAYLVKDEDGTLEKVLKSSPDLDQEKLQTIFNVNESFPDLRFESFAKIKKVSILEWFSRMKNVHVLYLGRWKSSDQHNIEEQSSDQGDIVWEGSLENHIEVESTEFLEGLKNMKRLRLLSLQGISRINELPDSIGKLTNLRILDLKACHNLEALPEGLALLKKLSHLDISECYLLDGMPKAIAFLTELQVLKGFVVGNLESNIKNNQQGLPRQFLGGMCFPQKRDSCTLKDLIKLKKLRKLSINTSIRAFPREEELEALEKLKELRKLAIAWSVNGNQQEKGAPSSADSMNSDNGRQDSGATKPTRSPNRLNSRQPDWGLPGELEKLVLQSFPDSVTPNWLMPGKLNSLEKLYIRGGKLIKLWQMQEGDDIIDKWKVKILGLKYLESFYMNMEELRNSFPKLKFLENVKCTKLDSLSQIEDVEVLYVPHDEDKHKSTVS